MNANKQNLTKYIAGILFLFPIMNRLNPSQLLWLLKGNSLWSLLQVCGNIILAISMVIQSKELFKTGAIFEVGSSFLRILYFVKDADTYKLAAMLVNTISLVLWLVSSILLFLSALNPGNAKTYCIISAGTYIFYVLLNFAFRKWGFWYSMKYVFDGSIRLGLGREFLNILGGIAILLSCFVLSYTEYSTPNLQPASMAKSTRCTDTDSSIEKLTKLKELLDMNIITQEEFDAKKKELLNL